MKKRLSGGLEACSNARSVDRSNFLRKLKAPKVRFVSISVFAKLSYCEDHRFPISQLLAMTLGSVMTYVPYLECSAITPSALPPRWQVLLKLPVSG